MKFADIMKSYTDLMKKTWQLSKDMSKHLKNNVERTKCQMIAERVMKFNFKPIQEFIIDDIHEMKNFSYLIAKGAYCSFCNKKYQNLFKVSNGKITVELSYSFLSKFLKSIFRLSFLLVVIVPKLNNLVELFYSSCDYNGFEQ